MKATLELHRFPVKTPEIGNNYVMCWTAVLENVQELACNSITPRRYASLGVKEFQEGSIHLYNVVVQR